MAGVERAAAAPILCRRACQPHHKSRWGCWAPAAAPRARLGLSPEGRGQPAGAQQSGAQRRSPAMGAARRRPPHLLTIRSRRPALDSRSRHRLPRRPGPRRSLAGVGPPSPAYRRARRLPPWLPRSPSRAWRGRSAQGRPTRRAGPPPPPPGPCPSPPRAWQAAAAAATPPGAAARPWRRGQAAPGPVPHTRPAPPPPPSPAAAFGLGSRSRCGAAAGRGGSRERRAPDPVVAAADSPARRPCGALAAALQRLLSPVPLLPPAPSCSPAASPLLDLPQDAAARPAEAALPPEVERLARFTDAATDDAGEQPHSLLRWWRYQGP